MGLLSRKPKPDTRHAAPAEKPHEDSEEEAEVARSPRVAPPEPGSDEIRVSAISAEPGHEPESAPEPAPETDLVPASEPAREATPTAAAPTAPADAVTKEETAEALLVTKEAADALLVTQKETAEAREEGPARMMASDLIAPTRQEFVARARQDAEPEAPVSEPVVYVFANQKGGVAKTTTTLNLAVAFKESGYRVLCIDLDPQGNLTMSQGIDPDKVEKSIFDVLVHDLPISEVIAEREIDIAVASIDLAGAEIAMSTKIGRERSLEKALREVAGDYDFVCIDTPPSLGLLTINAFTAADRVIVPVQCEYLSMRGLVQLQSTLRMIQDNLNPDVRIEGILPTMLDARTVHAKEAIEILEENFGDLVFKTRIRKTIKFAEAPVRGASVLKYDPQGNAAGYYRDLAKEVLSNGSS